MPRRNPWDVPDVLERSCESSSLKESPASPFLSRIKRHVEEAREKETAISSRRIDLETSAIWNGETHDSSYATKILRWSASIRTTFCETVLAAAATTTMTDKDGEVRAQTTTRSITYPARTNLEQECRIDRLLKRARKRNTREFGRNDALGNAINYNTELSRDNSVGA